MNDKPETRPTKNTFCFSCGKPCHKKEDFCYGCSKIVCVKCSNKYDHMGKGRHGKMRNKKPTA